MNSLTNQYLILDKDLYPNQNENKLGQKDIFFDYIIFYHKKLDYIKIISDNFSVALLGFIIDPFNPLSSNYEVILSLSKESKTLELLKKINLLSGRFVLLIKDKFNNYFICNDACGLRQIYYYNNNGQLSFSSFPELLLQSNGLNPQIDNETAELIKSKEFQNTEFAWYGDGWYDKRIKKILPNHYMALSDKKISRFPFIDLNTENSQEIIDKSIEILRNTYTSILNRFDNVLQPLTAGWDSRLLLSISKDFKDKIQYYIFSDKENTIPKEDVLIPSQLSKRLGINFKVCELEDLDKNFIYNFTLYKLFPRILPKTPNYYWHFKYSSSKNTININGNCAEITRNFYNHIFFNKNYFKSILYHSHFEDYFKPSLLEWREKLYEDKDWRKLNLLDLFYWEHRIGNWHSLYTFEQDVAIEEISPFNNRFLLLSLLLLPINLRKKERPYFYLEIIKNNWPECLLLPVNPIINNNIFKSIIIKVKKNDYFYKFYKTIDYYLRKKRIF